MSNSELLNFILDYEEAFKSRTRLASLYSDFRHQAQTNPDGYAANITAWRDALVRAARAGVIPVNKENMKRKRRPSASSGREPRSDKGKAVSNDLLCIRTGEELVQALEIQPWGRPQGLGIVIQDAVARKELIPHPHFQTSKHSIYSRSWIPTPWQVIQWSLRQLGVVGGPAASGDRLAVGRFVVVENVEAASNAILKLQKSLHQTSTSAIYSLQTFTVQFSNVLGASSPSLSANDISILLTYMSRDKPSLSYSPLTQTIRFSAPNASLPPEINENDVSIASIKTLLQSLETAISPLEERLKELDQGAREAVSNKQRTTALALLRRKKLIESTLEKRRANFLQLEETLQKIEEASDNVEIVQAMKTSTSVLRSLNEQVGGVEGVERVTEALREEMEKGEDISNVLNESGAEAVDEGEVDEEFEALFAEERKKVEAAERAEREKREAIERAEREEQDRREAESTKRKMAELAAFEKRVTDTDEIVKPSQQMEQDATKEVLSASSSNALQTDQIPRSPLSDATLQHDEETDLNDSIRSLGRMSLEELKPTDHTELKQKEREAVAAS